MEILENIKDKYVSLKPVGELDANSSMAMDEVIQKHMELGHDQLHIDCSELQYISSAGVGVFIAYHEELLEKGGGFVFSNMSENVKKVFELLGLHKFMDIVGSTEEVEVKFDAHGKV